MVLFVSKKCPLPVPLLAARRCSLFAEDTCVGPDKKLRPSSTKVAELDAVAFNGPPLC